MNINLSGNHPLDCDGEPEPFTTAIDDHVASMATAKFPVTMEHVLIPEGNEFPGSYQVWLKVCDDQGPGSPRIGWIYVDPDGVVLHRRFPGGKVEIDA